MSKDKVQFCIQQQHQQCCFVLSGPSLLVVACKGERERLKSGWDRRGGGNVMSDNNYKSLLRGGGGWATEGLPFPISPETNCFN